MWLERWHGDRCAIGVQILYDPKLRMLVGIELNPGPGIFFLFFLNTTNTLLKLCDQLHVQYSKDCNTLVSIGTWSHHARWYTNSDI
jgi:hypothetical protein